MKGYVFATQPLAATAVAQIDAAEGYPKAGTDVGGGRHVTPTFVTATHCQPTKHPTLAQWAILQDSVALKDIDGKGGIPVATDLDVTWGVEAAAAAIEAKAMRTS